MTVKQLIKKLSKCDPEATVIVENTELFIDGYYYVTNIDADEKCVLIESDHEKIVVVPCKGEEE